MIFIFNKRNFYIFDSLYQLFYYPQMNKQKRVWSEEEDAMIKELYEDKAIDNWNEISRIMSEQYHLPKKSAKQCKQRYQNHINSSIIRVEWTNEQEIMFIQLHNKIGNKWASIAQYLDGKSDNCVKNHFYSKLRKLLRKLNKIIYFYCKKQFRPIDIAIMYKIVEAAQERFKQKPGCQQRVSLQCLRVQNKMLQFAMFQEGEEDTPKQIQKYKELIKQIYTVSKMYKRKSKKVRNSLIQAPTIKKVKQEELPFDSNKIRNIVVQKSSANQNEQQDEVKQEYEEEKGLGLQFYNFEFRPSILNNDDSSKEKSERQQENNRIQIQQGDGIHQLLRNTGILHDQYNNMVFFGQSRAPSVNFPLSQRSSFKSYSQIDPAQNPFFDDSNNICGGLNFPMNFRYPNQK